MSRTAWKWWLFALGVMLCTVLAMPMLRLAYGEAGLFPVETLRVGGTGNRVSNEQVRAAVKDALSGGWFAVDPKIVRDRVAQLPWVASVQVRKQWPAALEVRIVERDALARWGDSEMINQKGEIFAIGDVPEVQSLPKISGPVAMRHELLAFYQSADASLAPHRLQVREMTYHPVSGLQVQLQDGLVVKVGAEDLAERWQRFVLAYSQIRSRNVQAPLAQVDLRYPYGLAVSWLPAQAEGGAEVALETSR